MKKLPIGISDFKELIEEGYYYVDKTLLIKELIQTNGKVLLIPRPRRFGKTLNLSMLRYFYERNNNNNESLFHNTQIWQEVKLRAKQGAYPVMFLTFKNVKEPTWRDAYEHLTSIITDEFRRHSDYLLPLLSKYDAVDYQAILDRTASRIAYGNSLFFLTKLLRKHYGKRAIVLIDEYDSPIHAAYNNGYYKDIIDFIRSVFTAVFKDNNALERGVLTGILRASKEGIFSGLNNLKVFTVLDKKFSDKFGFTPSEVDHLLAERKLARESANIKAWYNGYLCGKTTLYNPWSLLDCVDNKGDLAPYWANTSDNLLVKKLIAVADEEVKAELEALLQDIPIVKQVKETVIFPGIENDSRAVWSLLLFTGYLTFTRCKLEEGRKMCTLIIPNKEIKLLYQELIQSIFEQSLSLSKIKSLLQALRSGDSEHFAELLHEFIVNSMSIFDIPHTEPEKSYHLFVLGLLVMLNDHYEVKSNRESGYGRYDIMLIPYDISRPAIIMEFKKASTLSSESIQEAATRALEQIEEKKYAQELYGRGIQSIIAFGIAFQGKKIAIKSESL